MILDVTGARDLFEMEQIQELWSGYGAILRYGLTGASAQTVVVKHVCLPEAKQHTREWDTNLSHKRKLRSYEVEKSWYRNWSHHCEDGCRVPQYLGSKTLKQESLLILEDLDAIGYQRRKGSTTPEEMFICLEWMAHFHATFLGEPTDNLWKIGTYWHLGTRPDELKLLTDQALKNAAHAIDRKLQQSPFQTFVHGDAKLANFCFSEDGKKVAAVDFQYVGGGCGMKDVAYFIGSCLNERDCEAWEKCLLEQYFDFLNKALKERQKNIDIEALIRDWRALYPVAWTDFHRFIKGWSPGQWKVNSYSEQLSRKVLASL